VIVMTEEHAPMSALTPAALRERLHTRRIACEGFRRADGLWEVEEFLIDTKTYGFANHDRGTIEAGEPVHDMAMRVTLDDALAIRAVEVAMPATPFADCAGVAPNFQRLVGLRIGPGWRRAVSQRLGGPQGCTHLVELLGPITTTAYQTLHARRDTWRASALIDRCYALRRDGPAAARILAEEEG